MSGPGPFAERRSSLGSGKLVAAPLGLGHPGARAALWGEHRARNGSTAQVVSLRLAPRSPARPAARGSSSVERVALAREGPSPPGSASDWTHPRCGLALGLLKHRLPLARLGAGPLELARHACGRGHPAARSPISSPIRRPVNNKLDGHRRRRPDARPRRKTASTWPSTEPRPLLRRGPSSCRPRGHGHPRRRSEPERARGEAERQAEKRARSRPPAGARGTRSADGRRAQRPRRSRTAAADRRLRRPGTGRYPPRSRRPRRCRSTAGSRAAGRMRRAPARSCRRGLVQIGQATRGTCGRRMRLRARDLDAGVTSAGAGRRWRRSSWWAACGSLGHGCAAASAAGRHSVRRCGRRPCPAGRSGPRH